MSIPFTQYLLPDGRKQRIEIDMPNDVEEKAMRLLKDGCYFDIEVLTTGEISMTCMKGDDLISMVICANGPAVIDSVRKIVEMAITQHLPSESSQD